MRRVISFSFFVVILTTVSDWRSAASAKVIRLEIASKAYYGSFKAGDYELWEGRIIGELSPGESIPNIDKATRNARGLVDYAARITLLMPTNPARETGLYLSIFPIAADLTLTPFTTRPATNPFRPGPLSKEPVSWRIMDFPSPLCAGNSARVPNFLASSTVKGRPDTLRVPV